MVVVCPKTNAHCPMMRRVYHAWVKPKLVQAHAPALQLIEEERISALMDRYIDSREWPVAVKADLMEAAFFFQSDNKSYFDNLLQACNYMHYYNKTLELLGFLPQENWTPRCFVSAFHAYNRSGRHREAVAAFEKIEDRYKTDKIMIDAALCYARLGNFQNANITISAVPAEARAADMKALKMFLLQALSDDGQDGKRAVIEAAEQASKQWDDETRFLVAKLAIQTRDFRRAEGLYARESGSRPENRTKYFYEVMILVHLAREERNLVRKMLIEGQGKLPAPFLQETCNQFARNYFMVQHPGTRLVLLELYENLPGVKWENQVLAAVASGYYHQKDWGRTIEVAESIPVGQWEYSTLVCYVEACGRTGQQGKIDAFSGQVGGFLLNCAIQAWQARQGAPETIEEALEQAAQLAKDERYAEAVEIYRTFKKKHFTPEAAYYYVLCLLKLNQVQHAHHILGQIIDKERWDTRLARLAAQVEAGFAAQKDSPLLGLAMQAVEDGEWGRAIGFFRRIPVDAWTNEIVRQLVFCYRQSDRLEEARDLLTNVWTQEKWSEKVRRLARGLGLD